MNTIDKEKGKLTTQLEKMREKAGEPGAVVYSEWGTPNSPLMKKCRKCGAKLRSRKET